MIKWCPGVAFLTKDAISSCQGDQALAEGRIDIFLEEAVISKILETIWKISKEK